MNEGYFVECVLYFVILFGFGIFGMLEIVVGYKEYSFYEVNIDYSGG